MGKFSKKMYGSVVGKDSSDRPGWKGPSYAPKKKAPPATPAPKPPQQDQEPEIEEPTIPLELQQLLLNIFKDTFPEVLASNERQSLMQSVKTALYERDFQRAFGTKENLEVYAVRWSPSRALCYLSVLVDISEHLRELFPLCQVLDEDFEGKRKPGKEKSLKVIAFGGGAAEVVGFGGFLKHVLNSDPDSQEDVTSQGEDLDEGISNLTVSEPAESSKSTSQSEEAESTTSPPALKTSNQAEHIFSPEKEAEIESTTPTSPNSPLLDLTLIDTAEWESVSTKLTHSLTSTPPISKYAPAHKKTLACPLLTPETITTTFQTHDILSIPASQLSSILTPKPNLITLLFTLNELYTTSLPLTTKFLLNLTTTTVPGTLLLIIDSPGSYSTTTVNGSEKKYPMHWLLAHTLMETAKGSWERVVSEESKWWRLPVGGGDGDGGLRYPIGLENMRFQMHLFRRV